MSAQIIDRTESGFTVQVTVPYNHSMLDFEETLQQRLNDAGVVATAEGLQQFDTDGSPITVGPVKLTSKGQVPKDYQTPYGVATVERHVYQSPQGGATYCPLDRDARIVVSSTPKFAKIVSNKYAEFGSARVQHDLAENHGRAVSRCLIQDVADAVAAVALAKEEDWSYPLPKLEEPPATVAISLDGTCTLMCEDGWRETMVGTISFYDGEGERQHTIYLAATPEYGKATFLGRLEAEIGAREGEVPRGPLRGDRRRGEGELGVPGAAHRRAGGRLLACGGVPGQGGGGAVPGPARDARGVAGRRVAIALKHEPGGAECGPEAVEVAGEGAARGPRTTRMCSGRSPTSRTSRGRAGWTTPARVAANEPIGSGVTEAACKVIVKQRLCGSGMKWKESGAAAVLSLRCLSYTPERWDQFWSKIDRWGFPVAA